MTDPAADTFLLDWMQDHKALVSCGPDGGWLVRWYQDGGYRYLRPSPTGPRYPTDVRDALRAAAVQGLAATN